MKKKTAPIVIEDLLKFRYPSGLMYSPEGKTLAFTVAEADEANNSYRRNVWISKDGKASQLTASLSASALFWEDEDTLVLQRSVESTEAGTTDLFRISLLGGEAKPWLTLPFALGTMKKIKDGLYIAAGLIDANDPDAYKDNAEARKKKAEEKEKNKDYQVVDEVPYWFNGKGFTNKTRTALFRVETGTETKIRRLTGPFTDCSSFVNDGTTVYFTALTWKRKSTKKTNLYKLDAESGKTTTLYGKGDFSISNLFIRDHELYMQATDGRTYGINETGPICRYTENGFEQCAHFDRALRDTAATDTTLGGGKASAVDGEDWVTLASETDRVQLWNISKDFKKTVVFDQPGFVLCMDACAGKTAAVYSSPSALCEVIEMNHDGSDCRTVTCLNTDVLKDKYVAEPQEMTYITNGEELNGWVLLPKDYNPKKKYPGVLDVHGGPRAIYTAGYFHEMQVWASEGYFVFFTNIHGSDGRGDAFADIRGQYGAIDYQNLMDFTDAVLAKYPALDPGRLCETGGSYGGFMTNWIIGHTDRFCACASQRSIANWISKLFISDNGLWFNADQQGASNVYRDSDKLWEHSPLKYAENVKTPTLFIHSDEDYRCPLPEGMQMMQALAYQNVETRMCIFHGENHELSRGGKPTHRIRRLKEITDWFNKHAK